MHAVGWALLGALVAEAFTLSAMMRPAPGKTRWHLPWATAPDLPAISLAVVLRLFTGCALGAVGAASDQICDAAPAFTAGLVAPFLITKIFQIVTSDPSDTGQTSPSTALMPELQATAPQRTSDPTLFPKEAASNVEHG